MGESQDGEGSQGSQGIPALSQPGRFSPEFLASQFKPGQSGNAGGIEKASGLPGRTLRARLRDKLLADEKRLERILEARLELAEFINADNPGVTLKAIDDLFDQVEGKLEKTQRNTGEPTVVVINGPKPVAPYPQTS